MRHAIHATSRASQKPTSISGHNQLLDGLVPADRALLTPHLDLVRLEGGEILLRAGLPIIFVHFPVSAVAAAVEHLGDDTRLAVGMIGAEGAIGWPVLLGETMAHQHATVQLSGGMALRMKADTLVAICQEHPRVQARLLRFVSAYMRQMAQTVVSGLRDSVEQRIARWILMLEDRSALADLPLTHAQLSEMLNVRRASVTDGLHMLEGRGLLRCTRGHIQLRDREALQRLAGPTYELCSGGAMARPDVSRGSGDQQVSRG